MSNENNFQDLLKNYDKKLQSLQSKIREQETLDLTQEMDQIKQEMSNINHSISLLHKQIQSQTRGGGCDLSLKSMHSQEEAVHVRNFFNQIGTTYDSSKYDTYVRYNKAFDNYIKRSMDRCGANLSNEDREVLMMGAIEDGYALPGNYYTQLTNKMSQYSALRPYVSKMFTTQEEIQIPALPSTPAAWLNDEEPVTISSEKTAARTVKMNYQFVSFNISQKLLDDANFPIMDWMLDKVCDALARGEDKAISIGSSNNSIRPIISSNIEAISSASATLSNSNNLGYVETKSNTSITIEDLLSLVYSLPSYYLRGSVFIMNRDTMNTIRNMKDSSSKYIWKFNDFTCNNIDMLFGYPVVFVPNFPSIASSKAVAAFGNLKASYQLLDGRVRLIKDPYSKKPWVSFYVAKQTGGALLDNNALRLLKIK